MRVLTATVCDENSVVLSYTVPPSGPPGRRSGRPASRHLASLRHHYGTTLPQSGAVYGERPDAE
jgi:hypothetical protein